MKRMRKWNDEFRPFCLCPSDVMFVTRESKNSLFYVFDSLSNLDCGQWYTFWTWQSHPISAPVTQSVVHGQERLFCKVTSVSIYSFVEWFDTFSYVLRPADVTVKGVSHIRRFAINIAKDLILLYCRPAMEHLCALQLETALATLVTTWFTLADRRWRSRYRSSDQCTYIRLKIKPNSVRIRSLSCQICVLPSTGFELTPLIHCSTNRLALCPAP